MSNLLNYPKIAIDDLDQRSFGKYDEAECEARKNLAAIYRLVEIFGWSEGIYNHITCRVPNADDQFLILPFGFLYYEVTASSLVKVDSKTGNIVDQGSTNFGYINRGYTLHSAVLQARQDVNWVIHLHVPEIIAISSLHDGLIPFSQQSMVMGQCASYNFHGILTDLEERKSIVETLGDKNIMILQNHGFVVCGQSAEETFLRTYLLITHMKTQAILANVPKSSIILQSQEIIKKTFDALKDGENSGIDESNNQSIHWKFGELDWQAWTRMLDNMGLKTGYKSKLAVWKN